MNETMTLEEAARLVARAERWDDALARRTEGLSWMIWALVAPGILVTNAWLNATAPSY